MTDIEGRGDGHRMGGNIKSAILATNAVLIALSSAAIACRIGRRIFIVRSFSWHDALITVAAVSATIFSALQMISTRYGLGLNVDEISAANFATGIKLSLASRIFYFVCNWAVKHSLLLFYATLTIDYWPRISIYIMHLVAFSFGLTCILFTLVQCLPIRKLWVPPNGNAYSGECINPVKFNYFNSCFMLANDMVLYAMPLVFTWKLHVSRPQRIAVNLLFALGGLVLAASGTRIYFVAQQATTSEFTYRFAMTMVCAVIENHLAIIVACAPSIKVMLLHAFPSLELRFEKLVSKGSSGEGSEFSFGTLAIEEILGNGSPPSLRTTVTTTEGGKARGNANATNARKWWKPPSSWEVNKEGKEEGTGEKVNSSPA